MNGKRTENHAMYAAALISNDMPAPVPPRGLTVQRAATAGIGGLDRFVYLRGASGRRYVFSAVALDRAGLYDACVFAWRRAGARTAQPCAKAPVGAQSGPDAGPNGGQLYVHLVDGGDPAAVLADLRAAA